MFHSLLRSQITSPNYDRRPEATLTLMHIHQQMKTALSAEARFQSEWCKANKQLARRGGSRGEQNNHFWLNSTQAETNIFLNPTHLCTRPLLLRILRCLCAVLSCAVLRKDVDRAERRLRFAALLQTETSTARLLHRFRFVLSFGASQSSLPFAPRIRGVRTRCVHERQAQRIECVSELVVLRRDSSTRVTTVSHLSCV